MADASLRITEIFLSLQGEARDCGRLSVFVRLTGCPLRCTYCDSEYAFFGGDKISLEAIIDNVKSLGAQHVCVTGGEPLAQPNCLPLLQQLCDLGYSVSLETSGAMPIASVDTRVTRVVDLKTPDSGEVARNLWENLSHLNSHDQIKFVICSRQDYEWARFKVSEYDLTNRVGDVWFSPSYGQIEAKQLADWVVEDKLPVRCQLQLHKLLWGDQPGF